MTLTSKLQRLAALEKRHSPQAAAGFRIVVTCTDDPPPPPDYDWPPIPPGRRIQIFRWTPNGPNPWEYEPSFADAPGPELCHDEP